MKEALEGAAPDAVAPPPRHPRFPLLDALRAIAALCVVLVHVPGTIGDPGSLPNRLLLHMNVGVTIFFLLSGFLLYRPFIAHRTGGAPPPRVLEYAKRRVLRIFPAYWLVLTAVLLWPHITATTGDWVSQYLLVFTLHGSPDYVCAECGLAQTWSLVVEATFYATLPLYVLLAARIARGRRAQDWLRLELLLLAALSLVCMLIYFVVYDGVAPPLFGGSLLSYVLWFAFGMGLAAVSVAADSGMPMPALAWLRRHPGLIWAAAAAAYAGLCLSLPETAFIIDIWQRALVFVAFGVISLLLLMPAVFPRGTGLPHAALSNRLLAWLGLISYGIFLWHLPVFHEVARQDPQISFGTALLVGLPITIAIAALSYYLLERPILRLKNRRLGPRRPTRARTRRAPSPSILRDP